jgi:hypothetical protein
MLHNLHEERPCHRVKSMCNVYFEKKAKHFLCVEKLDRGLHKLVVVLE